MREFGRRGEPLATFFTQRLVHPTTPLGNIVLLLNTASRSGLCPAPPLLLSRGPHFFVTTSPLAAVLHGAPSGGEEVTCP